jgi:hypothetical protein
LSGKSRNSSPQIIIEGNDRGKPGELQNAVKRINIVAAEVATQEAFLWKFPLKAGSLGSF